MCCTIREVCPILFGYGILTVVRKVCNCFIPEAEADLSRYAAAARLLGVDVESVEAVLDGFRAHYGGLWVGGSVELTPRSLTFRPNAWNLAVHAEDYSFSVPLGDITGAEHSWGFVSGIVTVSTVRGTFKIRCFRARRFRDAINRLR